ncbi:hypothetical protein ACJ73_05571 [Blastomyces percursus]|uniref:Uncharacterized protein n=1 Tax=Blastomyces percursus TaxID=1658174 RepID=A0A1J9Q4P4_9EURO|nr:hypothetical protein ACJ73_05571 [Blastomyces percursus]
MFNAANYPLDDYPRHGNASIAHTVFIPTKRNGPPNIPANQQHRSMSSTALTSFQRFFLYPTSQLVRKLCLNSSNPRSLSLRLPAASNPTPALRTYLLGTRIAGDLLGAGPAAVRTLNARNFVRPASSCSQYMLRLKRIGIDDLFEGLH